MRDPPRAMGTARRCGGEIVSNTSLAKLRKPSRAPLPLHPEHRPQSASEPLVKIVQHRGCLAEAEVAAPSTQVSSALLHSLLHADSSCPTRQFSNPLFEPQDRFWRNAPSRFLAAREAEPKKLPVLRLSHRTLCLIHLELELRGEVPSDALHHSLPGSLAAHVDVASSSGDGTSWLRSAGSAEAVLVRVPAADPFLAAAGGRVSAQHRVDVAAGASGAGS